MDSDLDQKRAGLTAVKNPEQGYEKITQALSMKPELDIERAGDIEDHSNTFSHLLNSRHYRGLENFGNPINILCTCYTYYIKIRLLQNMDAQTRETVKTNMRALIASKVSKGFTNWTPKCGLHCGLGGYIATDLDKYNVTWKHSTGKCEKPTHFRYKTSEICSALEKGWWGRTLECTNKGSIGRKGALLCSCAPLMSVAEQGAAAIHRSNETESRIWEAISMSGSGQHRDVTESAKVLIELLKERSYKLAQFPLGHFSKSTTPDIVLTWLAAQSKPKAPKTIMYQVYKSNCFDVNVPNYWYRTVPLRSKIGQKVGAAILFFLRAQTPIFNYLISAGHEFAGHGLAHRVSRARAETDGLAYLIKRGLYNNDFKTNLVQYRKECSMCKLQESAKNFNKRRLGVDYAPTDDLLTAAQVRSKPVSLGHFACCDLCGPVTVTEASGTTTKRWILVILNDLRVTRLYIVQDQSAEAIVSGLIRHAARFGPVLFMSSDLGSNFIPLADKTSDISTDDKNYNSDLKNLPPMWRRLVEPQFTAKLREVGCSWRIFAKDRHEALGRAESVVARIKWSLKNTSIFRQNLEMSQCDWDTILSLLERQFNDKPIFAVNGQAYSAQDFLEEALMCAPGQNNVFWEDKTKPLGKLTRIANLYIEKLQNILIADLKPKNAKKEGSDAVQVRIGALVIDKEHLRATHCLRESVATVLVVGNGARWFLLRRKTPIKIMRKKYHVFLAEPTIKTDNEIPTNSVVVSRKASDVLLLHNPNKDPRQIHFFDQNDNFLQWQALRAHMKSPKTQNLTENQKLTVEQFQQDHEKATPSFNQSEATPSFNQSEATPPFNQSKTPAPFNLTGTESTLRRSARIAEQGKT
jgi:hypothetical protein